MPVAYDWAILEVVPSLVRGRRVPVGVVLHARQAGRLLWRLHPDAGPLVHGTALDFSLLKRHLDAYAQVCAGGPDAGPLGKYPPSERFHWLTAPRSAVLQTTPVHPGLSDDLDATLARLYACHVGS